MKKYSWALAIISLIISICALIASFRIETFHVGIESVMGLVTALMGICATFMVGWQIFSSINVNKELENLKSINDEFKSKIKKLDGLIARQKEEINKEKEERCLMKKELDAQLWSARAFSFTDRQPFTAYECHAESLCLYLELQSNERITNALWNMGVALNYVEKKLQAENNMQPYDILALSYNRSSKVNGKDWPIIRMSSNPSFQLIKGKVEELEAIRLNLNERVEERKRQNSL